MVQRWLNYPVRSGLRLDQPRPEPILKVKLLVLTALARDQFARLEPLGIPHDHLEARLAPSALNQ
jgi:hypothetical protein